MPRVPVRPALALGLAVPALLAGAAAAAPDPGVRSGTVVLRTTDDAGHCAAAPTARRVDGAACPTFPLTWAAPRGRATALVVVFHGHGHNGDQYAAQLADLAARDGVVAVAMGTEQLAEGAPSYRGPFDSVDEEARDAASAIAWARDRFGTGERTWLLATSMGGSGLAYFVDAATRPAAGDADATWVQGARPLPLAGIVDAEGIGSLAETWAEATGAEQPDPVDAREIEEETGGTPATAPDAYRARSLALLTPEQYRATGLPVAAVVHDLDDGLVPYDQTLETRGALAAAGVVLKTYDVVHKDTCDQGSQTTLSKNVPVPGGEQALCLAGHANENDPSTPVVRTATEALHAMLGGDTAASARVVNLTPPAG